MNAEQLKSTLRTLIATFGGMFAGWFAAKGWFTVDQVLSVLNSEFFIGLVASGIVTIWGIITHTQTNAVAVVSKIAEDPASPVIGVITAPTAEGAKLASNIPSPTVVPAGTMQAKELAVGAT